MKFMLLVCYDGGPLEGVASDEAPQGEDNDNSADSWVDEMDGRGIRLDGDRLRPPSDATTVRVRDGKVLLVDGPFAETKEVIAGYDIVECADLDEAIDVASKHPVARFGMIEIRPFWQE
jgi:hypothetical protein